MGLQVSGLKVCLKRQAVAPGCGVSRAFLKAQALLFGGYMDALQGQQVIGLNCLFQIIHGLFEIVPDTVLSFQDGQMVFNEEVFLEHKSSSMRQFLQSAVHLQFFKQVNYASPARYCHLSDSEDTTTLHRVDIEISEFYCLVYRQPPGYFKQREGA